MPAARRRTCSRAFEPFKPEGQHGGRLGLGLYIVDHFVRAHGGTAEDGNTAEGALLRFEMPCHAGGGSA